MSDTPLLALPILEASQAQKHVTHNEALLILDAAIQLSVITRDAITPPVSPADGDRYLLGLAPTGVWTGQGGKLAVSQAGGWFFATPREGWRLWAEDEDKLLVFDGAIWLDIQGAGVATEVDRLGVNTTADNNNRLAVSSPAVLFNHAGSDQRLKINKQAASDTGSLLFQTDFSGRAEMGLAGDDNFHVKVSADGSAWNEALVVDRTTGAVTLPNTPSGDAYAARSSLVSAVGGGLSPPDGTVTSAGGLFYLWQTGAAELPGLPGLVPVGVRTLRHYGAIGDGSSDDSAAVLAALNSGKAIDGEGMTYGLSGNCAPTPAVLALANARLKQIAPTATTRTLHIVGVTQWFLLNVSVDMGALSTAGTIQNTFGIHIDGGSGSLRDVLVENGGPSTAIGIHNASHVFVENCTIQNMAWNLSGITDDTVQGLWLLKVASATITGCTMKPVNGTNNGSPTARFSRGFVLSGTTWLVITNCHAAGFDQGFDFTGSDGNSRFVIANCQADDCGTFGFKFSNTASNGQVTGCIASNCGQCGFIVSPWSVDLSPAINSQRIAFTNCRAWRTGSNGVWVTSVVGFRVATNGASPGYPREITFVNCHAIDDQAVPTMQKGFLSDVALVGNMAPGIAADAMCSSVGHLDTDFQGINVARDAMDVAGNHAFAGGARFASHVTVGRTLSLERQNLTLVNGNNNDLANYGSYTRLNGPTAGYTITGLTAPATLCSLIILHNTTSQPLTIKHQSGLSAVGNRIRCMDGADLVLPSTLRSVVWLIYDGAESVWIVVGWTATGGGGTGDVAGPNSSNDNALARFDSTTGKLLQDSSVTLDDSGILTFPLASVPAPPSAGKLALFARNVGGRPMLAMMGPSGLDTVFQPDSSFNSIARWMPNGSSTGITLDRAGSISSNGTATTANVAVTNRHTRMKRIEYTSPSASNAVASFRSSAAQWTVGASSAGDGGFQMKLRWAPATGVTLATHRAFAGMAAAGSPTDQEASNYLNQIGMGWDSADTNIQVLHNDGSGTCTKIDLGAAFPKPTLDRTHIYEIVLFSPPGMTQSCDYRVTDLNTDAVASGTIITDLPANTQLLAPRCYFSVGGTTSAIAVALMGLSVECDY